MKIRIYCPEYPFPPREEAHPVICDQIRIFFEMGFQVELAYWHGESRTTEGPHPKLRSYFLKGSKKPGFFRGRVPYPREVLFHPANQLFFEKGEVDLAIYHHGSAYAWFKDFPKAIAQNEKRRVIMVHQGPLPNVSPLAVDEVWFTSPVKIESWKKSAENPNQGRWVAPTFSESSLYLRNRRYKERLAQIGAHEAPVILGFIGQLESGAADSDRIQWILDELAPRLEANGFDGEIWIAGRGSPKAFKRWLRKARRYEFVRIMNSVEDWEDFWAHLGFMILPCFADSEVPLRLYESLSSGVPSLTTVAGAQQLGDDLRKNSLLFISDDPGLWVKHVAAFPDLRASYVDRKPLADGKSKDVYQFLLNAH